MQIQFRYSRSGPQVSLKRTTLYAVLSLLSFLLQFICAKGNAIRKCILYVIYYFCEMQTKLTHIDGDRHADMSTRIVNSKIDVNHKY